MALTLLFLKKYFQMYKFLFSLSILFFLVACNNEPPQTKEEKVEPVIVVKEPVIEYGFNLDSFQVENDTILKDWTLSHLLAPHNVSQWLINQAAEMAADSTIGLKYIKKGTPVLLLFNPDDTVKNLQYCIYPKNRVEYVIFDFSDSVNVRKGEKENSVTDRMLSGEIIENSNLTLAINAQLKDLNMTGEMAEYISGLFAWTIDFFKLHPGDEFKVIYEEKSVEGVPYDVGNVKYAYFKHQGRTYYSFYYLLDSATNKYGVYDETGKEMKRQFLMAPVKYSRISSSYSGRRFHPVQKRWKSHLGTDYAAPKGTPIWATADGYVIAASYTRGNGNYVKIKHNDTYSTQYLHMTGFASGIKKGVHVKQGQTIGYVGSTGLATGPHVCYRFWKNGKQINHRAEKFPATTPMPDSILPNYLSFIEPYKLKLDSMEITPYRKDTLK